jgi:tetratricopeptide (TPR) repeat protein
VLSPQQREARALGALIDQLLGLALHSPVLLILEDAHWIDPATRELITQTLARTADARVLMVITHRQEFQSDWTRHPQVTALTLNRLSRGQSAEIARAAAAAALTEEIVARILRRADGVPLFIEELTRSVTDASSAAGDSVPETLQASLLARLDRLGSDMKEVAQIAAVIGREFGSDLLCAVVGKSKDELTPALGQLVASQIVLPAGTAQGGLYLFRHALIQDAAYQLLLLSRRRQYHAEIARTLEGRFAETDESHPELIAQHYTAAALPEQAIPYWVKAGERALAHFAYLEPISHFERGLDLARALPEGPARSRQILNLLLLLAEARFRNKHLHEALQMFREAFDLARTDGSPADLARAASGAQLAESHMGVVQQKSIALLEAALDAFGESGTAERSRVLGRLGIALAQSGAFERATTLMSRATDLARRRGDPRALLEALIYSELYAKVAQPCTGPQFEMRRQLLGEMWNIAEQLGDPDMLPHLFSVSMAAFLEIVDLAGFEAQFIRFEQLLEEGRIVGGQNHYLMTTSSAMRAILHGDFLGADRWAEQALEVAHDIQPEVATGVYGVQMFTIRREQGRLAEAAPLFRRFLAKNPQESAWRPGLALIASDLGFEQAARKAFDDMATAGFKFAADAKRNITLCYLAEVCARLGDADRAGPLYELLLPYRDLAVVVPSATVCCGATARYLGMLAGLMRDWTAAEQHFEAAVDIDERLQAWPWLAHTKHEFALMLQARDLPGDRERAQTLLAEATASAERFGMASLQSKIRAVAN